MKTSPASTSYDSTLLKKLLHPGVLGIFNHVEVTSILAHHKPSKRNVNVLTHLVTVERTEFGALPDRPLKIAFSKLTEWSFGLTQHSVPLDVLFSKLDDAIQNGQWSEAKSCLEFGTLFYQGHWFVPPAGGEPDAPINRLLKNNFWNGSHVWEWTAAEKSDFLPFFEKPPLLQALSEGVSKYIPIQIASVSDKLGGIVLQIPVTCMVSDYLGTGDVGEGVICEIDWHPEVSPRPLTITAERWHDGRLSSTSVKLESGNQVRLSLQDGPGGVKAVIRDDVNDVVLGTMEVNILSSVHAGIHVADPECRTFKLVPNGNEESIKVTHSHGFVSGDPNRLAHFDDARKRIYGDEMRLLRERREFVQYRPDELGANGVKMDSEQRHCQALKDLRYLIRRYGEEAAWLWDPYLNASDILKTLFFNHYAGSNMRALTGAMQAEEDEEAENMEDSTLTKKEKFVIAERERLNQSVVNLVGLKLEFRAKVGSGGFAFHDRFLIFPHAEPEPLAWSLGISVNGVGKDHHILQKVPNGRLIADAFQELWDALNKPEQLVWKAP